MLDSAIIHRTGNLAGRPDLGRILETMLYYDRVHLAVGTPMIVAMWETWGPSGTRAVLDHPTITATICPEMLGVQTDTRNCIQTHRPVTFSLAGRAGDPPRKKPKKLDSLLMHLESTKRGASRAELNQVLKRHRLGTYAESLGGSEHYRLFAALANDPETLKLFARGQAASVGALVNESVLRTLHIEVMELGNDRIMVSSSPPLEHAILAEPGVVTWAQILAAIQEYAVDLGLSTRFSADIVTAASVAEVAAARTDLSINRASASASQISAFEEMVFDDAHIFADAYNSGVISLDEALRAIDESRKFRQWLRGLPPDANLVHEYHRALSKDTILGKLPGSLARFSIFNGAGLVGDALLFPGAGVLVSAVDTFVVQKLLGGWRPNVFVKNIRSLVVD